MTTITSFPHVDLDGLTLLFRVEGGPIDVDAQGVEWILTKFDGWTGRPAPRTGRTDRPGHSGTFRSPGYRQARSISMEWIATAPDEATLRAAEVAVAGLCADPAQLYPLVVTEAGLSRQIMVELDDAIIPVQRAWNQTIFATRVAAPDPRKHDTGWQSPVGSLRIPPSGGLSFTGGALLTSPGADFGTIGTPSAASVHNAGTVTAYPFFAVAGPLAAGWQIIDIGSGVAVTYTKPLGPTDSLVINTDSFPVNGFPGHGVYLNQQISQRTALLTPSGWPSVAPGANATYNLRSPTFSAATMTVSLRSAWH